MLKHLKLFSPTFFVCRSSKTLRCSGVNSCRSFADTARTDLTTTKQVVGTENEQRVRVRRARSSDVPRILKFVREHSRTAWPSLISVPISPTAASQLVLADYVARALAQGHSMIAEQISSRRGWLTVRGLALGSTVCPWDAMVLDQWARCLRDMNSRRLINLTAHCLRAPNLHEKYRAHNILQVILILSPETKNNPEIVQMLAKSAIQRGREVGLPLLRFDVTDEKIAKALEELEGIQKEWHLSYHMLSEVIQEVGEGGTDKETPQVKVEGTNQAGSTKGEKEKGHFISVFTAFTNVVADRATSKPSSAPDRVSPVAPATEATSANPTSAAKSASPLTSETPTIPVDPVTQIKSVIQTTPTTPVHPTTTTTTPAPESH